MKDLLIVPEDEYKTLQEYYKGQVTSNALMDKIGKLQAQEHLILKSNIPDSLAVKMVKPLSRQRRVLTRRVKRGSAPITVRQTEEEPEAEVDTPAEALLKRLIKKQVETPAASAKKGIKRQAGYDSDDLGPDPMGSAFGKKGKAKAKKAKKNSQEEKKRSTEISLDSTSEKTVRLRYRQYGRTGFSTSGTRY